MQKCEQLKEIIPVAEEALESLDGSPLVLEMRRLYLEHQKTASDYRKSVRNAIANTRDVQFIPPNTFRITCDIPHPPEHMDRADLDIDLRFSDSKVYPMICGVTVPAWVTTFITPTEFRIIAFL